MLFAFSVVFVPVCCCTTTPVLKTHSYKKPAQGEEGDNCTGLLVHVSSSNVLCCAGVDGWSVGRVVPGGAPTPPGKDDQTTDCSQPDGCHSPLQQIQVNEADLWNLLEWCNLLKTVSQSAI